MNYELLRDINMNSESSKQDDLYVIRNPRSRYFFNNFNWTRYQQLKH